MIRQAKTTDAPAFRDIYSPFVTDAVTSFETEVPEETEFGNRIRNLEPTHPWLAYEEAGCAVGYAYASAHRTRAAYRWSTDVAIYLHPTARRRGIGTALYKALFEVLSRQGYVNAYAGIAVPNDASIGLHTSLGFHSVGVYEKVGYKFGAWHDVMWLQLRLADSAQPVPRILAPSEVLALGETRALFRQLAATVAPLQ